ncbi:MAG: NAD-dependent epimerase/dehydratase family protein, partial [Gammaproteobacteria bacterium]|nr:NAD-dependent epimerase/dehydratase family protein [Gammaproteobacteria bacterium]
MDRRCLIAGCGYVGRRLAARLQPPWQVVALARSMANVASLRAAGIDTIVADLDASPLPQEIRARAEGAAIAYLAPPPESGTTDPRIANLLDALGDRRPDVFLYMSTTGVYGDTAGAAVDETSPVMPTNDRSRRRVAAEQLVRTWCEARNVRRVVLRVPGIYGPQRLPLERLQRGEPALRPEDAGPANRIHVDDLVTACVAAIERPVHGVFNVGDGDHSSTTAYLQATAQLAGLPPPELVSLADARGRISPGMLAYLVETRRVETRRKREELGVTPR